MSEHEPPQPPFDPPFDPPGTTPDPNPYEAGVAYDSGIDCPDDLVIITAELVEPAETVAAPRPPLWPAFVTSGIAVGAFVFASTLALVGAALATEGTEVFQSGDQFRQWMEGFSASSWGLAVLMLPGQIAFGLVTVVASLLSREPFQERLGLGRGHWSPWCWPLFLFGTPIVAVITSLLLNNLLSGPSEHLEQLDKLVEHHTQTSVLMLLCVISLTPGIVEELLFRGFVQRRLLARLPVAPAILITSAFFAAAHLDPMHAMGVAPLGIWLGVIAWRANSIWPSILGHIGNNAFAVLAIGVADQDPESVAPLLGAVTALAILSFVGCLVVLVTPVDKGSGKC